MSSKVLLRISGKKFELPAVTGWTFETRPGGWIIANGPNGVRRRFAMRELRGTLSVEIEGRLFHGEVQQQERHGSGVSAGSDADLIAQFPGKVRKILVTAGKKVAEGEPLILVEAMKMEFTVKCPYPGTVQKILVTEGQQLLPGDRFFDIAAENGNG